MPFGKQFEFPPISVYCILTWYIYHLLSGSNQYIMRINSATKHKDVQVKGQNDQGFFCDSHLINEILTF